MKKIQVRSSSHSYPIYLGKDLFKNFQKFLPKKYSNILIITDQNVARLYLDDLLISLKDYKPFVEILSAGEQSKSIESYYQLQTKALAKGLDRQSLIIALGGGVIGDLAGFVAATFMRGIDFIQVPTTILAHDSSIGGKVAINHELGKNLLGSFHAPRAVVFDLLTLQSLPQEEVRSGYAEIVKAAFISRADLLSELFSLPLRDIPFSKLSNHILQAIYVKKEIVEKDERESYERMYLNFGHTLGHAIELAYDTKNILHGEAVALGMLFALFVSEKVYEVKLPIKKLYLWMKMNKYPFIIEPLTIKVIIEKMKQDKKNKDNLITLILLKDINQLQIDSFSIKEIEEYLNMFIKSLRGGFND